MIITTRSSVEAILNLERPVPKKRVKLTEMQKTIIRMQRKGITFTDEILEKHFVYDLLSDEERKYNGLKGEG